MITFTLPTKHSGLELTGITVDPDKVNHLSQNTRVYFVSLEVFDSIGRGSPFPLQGSILRPLLLHAVSPHQATVFLGGFDPGWQRR